MKTISLALVCLLAAIAAVESRNWPLKLRADLMREWTQFKARFGKSYATPEEEAQRLGHFEASLARIREHNAKANKSHRIGLNRRSDWSPEERATLMGVHSALGGQSKLDSRLNAERTAEFLRGLEDEYPHPAAPPKAVDWRNTPGRVSEVRDQGMCGSCWAFAAAGALEGQELPRLKSKSLVTLSVQNLVDCSTHNNGCSGGDLAPAFDDIAQLGGLESDQDYQYIDGKGKCNFDSSRVVLTDSGHLTLSNLTEAQLADVVAKFGPVAIEIHATNGLIDYMGGVWQEEDCPKEQPNHAVLIVGYGVNSEAGYFWIVKNSWGVDFGEDGYFRMKRGKNMCGIMYHPTIPRF